MPVITAPRPDSTGKRSLPPEEPYQPSHLPKGVKQTPDGDIGEHRGMEAYEVGTFSGCETMTKKRAGWASNKVNEATDSPYRGKGA
jgi:hypothetical protein